MASLVILTYITFYLDVYYVCNAIDVFLMQYYQSSRCLTINTLPTWSEAAKITRLHVRAPFVACSLRKKKQQQGLFEL